MKSRKRLMTALLIAALCVTLIGTVWASEKTAVMDAVNALRAAVGLSADTTDGPYRAADVLKEARIAASDGDISELPSSVTDTP